MSKERQVYYAGRMLTVPPEAILLAIDFDGDIFWYKEEPVIFEPSMLWNTSHAHKRICNIGDCENWRETLTDINDCLNYDPTKTPDVARSLTAKEPVLEVYCDDIKILYHGMRLEVPLEAKFIAMDRNKEIYWYEVRPTLKALHSGWDCPDHNNCDFIAVGDIAVSYQNSLMTVEECRQVQAYNPSNVSITIGGKEIKGFHDCHETAGEVITRAVSGRLSDFKVDARIVQHGNPTRENDFKERMEWASKKINEAFAARFINGTSKRAPKGWLPELNSKPELIAMDDMERETDKAVKQYLDDNVPPPLHHDMAKQIKSGIQSGVRDKVNEREKIKDIPRGAYNNLTALNNMDIKDCGLLGGCHK